MLCILTTLRGVLSVFRRQLIKYVIIMHTE